MEFAALAALVESYWDDGMTAEAIVTALQRDGVAVPLGAAQPWDAGMVSRVLLLGDNLRRAAAAAVRNPTQ
jgi:hypothetical protein